MQNKTAADPCQYYSIIKMKSQREAAAHKTAAGYKKF